MNSESYKDYQDQRRAKQPKIFILGGIGGAIGAATGGCVGFFSGNYLFAGLGAAVGIILGNIAGLALDSKFDLKVLQRVEGGLNVIAGLLSFLLALAGLGAFLLTGEWIALLGLLFFGMIGIYLMFKPRLDENNVFLALMSLMFVVGSFAMMVREQQISILPVTGAIFFGLGFIIFILKAKTS